MLFPVKSSFFK